ncbi:MAG: hypothetical protein AAFP70_11500 [Calditrichota bacterium]
MLALTREINRHKMRLITLKPGVINKHGNLDMLPIEIQASGGFRDVCRLIYTLESMGNNYQIRRFSQQLQKETSVVTDVELSLDVILHKRENIEKSG